jgi:hypothetical protein
MSPDFDDLIGADVPAEERERLRRAHDLLIQAGPPPELPPELEHPVRAKQPDLIPLFPKRRYAAAAVLAAALAAVAFGGGYLVGHSSPKSAFAATWKVRMHGTAAAPNGLASIQGGTHDESGNWPMLVTVSNLPQLPPRGYYTLWLTKKGKPVAPCGSFLVYGGQTSVTFTVAYPLRRYDGWVLTVQVPGSRDPGPVVLTTV